VTFGSAATGATRRVQAVAASAALPVKNRLRLSNAETIAGYFFGMQPSDVPTQFS